MVGNLGPDAVAAVATGSVFFVIQSYGNFAGTTALVARAWVPRIMSRLRMSGVSLWMSMPWG